MTISEFKCRNEGCLKIKYDKNEFYAENGLAKGHKKDRKSRSKNNPS